MLQRQKLDVAQCKKYSVHVAHSSTETEETVARGYLAEEHDKFLQFPGLL